MRDFTICSSEDLLELLADKTMLLQDLEYEDAHIDTHDRFQITMNVRAEIKEIHEELLRRFPVKTSNGITGSNNFANA